MIRGLKDKLILQNVEAIFAPGGVTAFSEAFHRELQRCETRAQVEKLFETGEATFRGVSAEAQRRLVSLQAVQTDIQKFLTDLQGSTINGNHNR